MIRKRFPLRRLLLYSFLGLSLVVNLIVAAALARDAGLRQSLITKLQNALGRTEEPSVPVPPGRWIKGGPPAPAGEGRAEAAKVIEQLEAVGYLTGSREAPQQTNVTVNNPDRTCPGFNLYTAGHAPEAMLIDMQGTLLHKWSCDARQVWPQLRVYPGAHNHEYWRRVHLLENGELLAIFEGLGLVKLGKHSNIIWDFPGRAHHDLEVTPEGTIFVLTRTAHLHPRYDREKPILEDFISILNPDGVELERISILECVKNSDYAPLLDNMPRKGDIFHTNTIELLDGRLARRSPAFKQGNVLVSIRNLDLIGVIDLDAQQMVWALTGLWRRQHQPTVLDNGNMLIFDNRGLDNRSRVFEFDPFSQELLWSYAGTPDRPFFSFDCGSSAQLPNGNVLVTDSNNGRAFELTPDKEIVWEFIVPHRAGQENELIATLFEMIRLPPDFPRDWLD